MATIAQINANIGNSKLSTGPRTPEGKQASSRNSLRHGLYASFNALPAEDRAQVEEILAHFSEQFPQPEAEQQLHELALAWFRRDRVRAMEAAFLNLQLERASEQAGDLKMEVSRELLLASILIEDSVGKRNLDRLHRWDRAYSRDIDRAFKALKSLPQAEPTEPATETAGTNPTPLRLTPQRFTSGQASTPADPDRGAAFCLAGDNREPSA